MDVGKYTNIIIILWFTIYYTSSHFIKSSFSSLSGEIYTLPAFPADFLKTTPPAFPAFSAFPARVAILLD